ncbi:RNA polymerase sigma-70 factor (ECF subfamily) [Polymorphobacter multimanifer]|uniref:RNA polymerase sigma-70 factor (ECF subfamily) n=1 Tax=Polymorphobacter multimanifer TaxID=1070431 RepID=A0A841LCQ0_9SPHN|nr:RNA polymerase sigma-70 factor (ECF subfamily) [Polymorphobacter multimanifer]
MSNNHDPRVAGAQVRARLDWFKGQVLPHEAALRARLRRIMPRRADLDDIVAEALARAFATEDFARVTGGRAWLFRIARNLIIDQARRDKIISFEQLADFDLIASDVNTEARLEARDELRRLEAIVDTLPIQCRRAFILRRIYDKPVAEIAEEMGLSVSTVDKHIARATAKVMVAIGEFEEFRVGGSLQQDRRAREA